MKLNEQREIQKRSPLSLHLKCGIVFLLLLTNILMVACSLTGHGTDPTNLGAPPVTVTIRFNTNLTTTPLPTQAPYLCGAWITNTSPDFIPNSIIPVYAKFVHLVNGNPQGMAGATAQATVYFANNTTFSPPATTTGTDGLAVFSFSLPNDMKIANHNNLVTVTFTGTDGSKCTVDQSRAAYFTPLLVTPTPTITQPSTTPNTTPSETPGVTTTVTPTVPPNFPPNIVPTVPPRH
jgi:hypothetical protein